MDQRTRQRQLFFHAAGEVGRATLREVCQACEAQEPFGAFATFPAAHAKDVGVEIEVFLHAQIAVEVELLRHVADAAFNRLGLLRRVETGHGPDPHP